MDPQKEKEEVIELTEVVEEGPAFAIKKDPEEWPPSFPEKVKDFPSSSPSGAPSSAPLQFPEGMAKDLLSRQAENWAAKEGTRLVERLAGDFIPRIVTERLSPELVKLQGETDALHKQGEAFARRLEEWFSSAGLKSLEEKAGEALPRLVAEAFRPEIEALRGELEKIRAQGEELGRRTESWFEKEGKEILERAARELFPEAAERVLRQEIERLKEEGRPPGKE
jgi:hypothetical protein